MMKSGTQRLTLLLEMGDKGTLARVAEAFKKSGGKIGGPGGVAEQLGVYERTVGRWVSGGVKSSGEARPPIEAVRRIALASGYSRTGGNPGLREAGKRKADGDNDKKLGGQSGKAKARGRKPARGAEAGAPQRDARARKARPRKSRG
jgi:hypothetical protein